MRINDIPTEQLREELRNMKEHHTLYKLIREELKHRGRWKNKPRGIAFKKGVDARRAITSKAPQPKFNDLYRR